MNIIVLMSGDPWLTKSSLEIEGIFSGEIELKQFLSHLFDKGIISQHGFKRLAGEYDPLQRQCEIKDGVLTVEKYELNPKTSSLSK